MEEEVFGWKMRSDKPALQNKKMKMFPLKGCPPAKGFTALRRGELRRQRDMAGQTLADFVRVSRIWEIVKTQCC